MMTPMNYLLPILMLLLGLALGGGAVWLLLRTKIGAGYDRGRGEAAAETAALSEKVVARDESIEELRGRLAEKDGSLGSFRRKSKRSASRRRNSGRLWPPNRNRPKKSWPCWTTPSGNWPTPSRPWPPTH